MASEKVIVFRTSGSEELLQDPTEARKALEAIDIRLTNKPISLLQHKIYNVWIAFAQSTSNAADIRVFEFPLSEVMELCGFDSHNHAYFIDAAREMLDLRVEYNSLGRHFTQHAPPVAASATRARRGAARPALKWAAAQLVSFIEIDSSANLMRIEFPDILRKEILRPDFYRSIDLGKQRLFTSRAGLTLYEYVLRFAAEQATPWLPWENYSMLLSGAAEPHKTFREYSKMLQRAIEQVNAHHDSHQIHAEFTKRGRAIEKMRIVIALRHQNALRFDATPTPPAPELLRALAALGLNAREATALATRHPRAYLDAQIAYTRRRLADRDRGMVKVPAAYLRSAIQGNYAGYVERAPGAEVIALPARAQPPASHARNDESPIAPSRTVTLTVDNHPATTPSEPRAQATGAQPPTRTVPAQPRDQSVGARSSVEPTGARPIGNLTRQALEAIGLRAQPGEPRAPAPGDAFARVRAWYAALDAERRADLAQRFLAATTPIVRKVLESKGLASPVAANAFYGWLRERGHPEQDPTGA